MGELSFRAAVTGFSADPKKVTAKPAVDPTDVTAHEELLHLRGRTLVVTVREEQEPLDFGDGHE